MRANKWKFGVVATVAMVMFLLGLAVGPALAGGSVRIGVIGPMTGPAADTGRQIRDASILAAKEINAQGGILGKKIELFYADDESKPAVGVTEVIKLIEKNKIDILSGGLHSDVALATMEVTPRYKIPYIITGPISQTIASKISKNMKKYGMVFKTDASSLTYGAAWGEFNEWLLKSGLYKPEKKDYVVIMENTDYGRACAKAAEEKLKELGYKLLYTEIIDFKTVDFYPILSKIKASKPDIVWSVQSATASGLALIRQFQEVKIPALFQSTYVMTKPDFLKAIGKDAAYAFSVQAAGLVPGQSDVFVKNFKKMTGEKPGLVAGLQYDIMYMIRNAAKRAGSMDPKKFVEAYENTKYKGTCGTYVYGKKDHQIISGLDYLPSFVYQFMPDGKRVLIFPAKYGDGKVLMPPGL
ncbi:MAG: ABC transporter substrate-binding protein [Desulfobacteraceae bacterium]|nr:ABC transporter substrate-binding protein [Desulfobacteraceae bacterium]